jgi:hypothetical protein
MKGIKEKKLFDMCSFDRVKEITRMTKLRTNEKRPKNEKTVVFDEGMHAQDIQ